MKTYFIQQIFLNGLTMGLIWVLIALGLSFIYSIMKVYNFAHGQFYMVGAVLTYYFFEQLHIKYFFTMFIVMGILFFLGVLVERVLFRPIRGHMHPGFMVSLGLSFIIGSVALLSFGEQPRAIKGIFPGMVRLFAANISLERLIPCLVSIILVLLLYSFIKWTKLGTAMRAVAQDPEAAQLQGVNLDLVHSLGMGVSSALAGAAGALVAPILFIDPFIGDHAIFRALIIVIFGGMGSLPGTVLGGLILGQIESFGYTYLGNITAVICWCVLGSVILFRPRGLLGKEFFGS
jgi:branched-chain amino acid transport system permease protein